MKNKIISIIFVMLILVVGAIGLIKKDTVISYFERRKLAQFPKINDEFTENLDSYLLDQFAFRNWFINLNSIFNRKVLKNSENNNVYIVDNNIIDKNYPINERNVNSFVTKTNYIIDNYLQNSNVYYSIIPDKAYFLDESKYLKLDYSKIFETRNEINANYINIAGNLSLDDYYKTDIHWKQENLDKVVEKITENMNVTKLYDEQYYKKQYTKFYGASYAKAGENISVDTLTYMTSDEQNNIKVNHLEFGEKNLYDTAKLENVDSYDVFLSGASSFIEIENLNNNISENSKLELDTNQNVNINNQEDSNTNKELIIFRDSFASSLAPVLTKYYNKITLIDLRYIDFDLAKDMVDFENKDVLFLYSSLIINNSSILKVKV